MTKAILLLAFALAGCSLTTSLNGLSSGNEDAPAGDPPPTPGASTEQTPNAPSGESTGGGEAITTPAPVSRPSFCASLTPRPTSCVDFDTTPTLQDWSRVINNKGEVNPTDDAKSAHTGIEMKIVSPQADTAAALTKSVIGSVKLAEVSFDVRVVERNPTKKYDVATMQLVSTAGLYELQIEQDNNGTLFLVEKATGLNDRTVPIGRSLPAGATAPWTRVSVALDAATKHALVTIGEDPVVDVPLFNMPAAGVRDPRFVVGDEKQDDAPYTLHFDDLTANVLAANTGG